MGVYIKGMKMPDTCWDCPLFSGRCCRITHSVFSQLTNNSAGKPDDCPMIEVNAPRGRKTMTEHSETIRILHYGDADYPEVMQYAQEICDIVRVGNLDCVPLYQVINRLQEPKCNYWHRDDETGEIQRNCEG